jgi:hypothetical protein
MVERRHKRNSTSKKLTELLFADDQVVVLNTEDNLHIATYKLNQIITKNCLTVFALQKTKIVTFKTRSS